MRRALLLDVLVLVLLLAAGSATVYAAVTNRPAWSVAACVVTLLLAAQAIRVRL